jgi:hypothetical protein
MVDTHGIWLAHLQEEPPFHFLLLFNPGTGLERLPSLGNFDSIHPWFVAGPCLD